MRADDQTYDEANSFSQFCERAYKWISYLAVHVLHQRMDHFSILKTTNLMLFMWELYETLKYSVGRMQFLYVKRHGAVPLF